MFKVALLILALLIPATVWATRPNDEGEHKTWICHRTNSATNPYVKIEVDYSAIDSEGQNDHMSHTGAVPASQEDAQTLKDQKIDFGDVIPPVEGVTLGLNWTTTGQLIFENDCQVPQLERCPFDESLPATHPNCVEPPEEEPPEEPELPPVDEEDETEVRSKVKVDMSTVLKGK